MQQEDELKNSDVISQAKRKYIARATAIWKTNTSNMTSQAGLNPIKRLAQLAPEKLGEAEEIGNSNPCIDYLIIGKQLDADEARASWLVFVYQFSGLFSAKEAVQGQK